jgi:hypothetical protein
VSVVHVARTIPCTIHTCIHSHIIDKYDQDDSWKYSRGACRFLRPKETLSLLLPRLRFQRIDEALQILLRADVR